VVAREEALRIISHPPLGEEQFKADREYVMKKLGFTEAEYEKIMSLPCKSVFDYPSYYPMIERFTRVTRTFVRFLLPWTPMIFYEMDARRERRGTNRRQCVESRTQDI
jgi:hypothetical protein